MVAQLPQRSAHPRLRDVDALCGARDIPFGKERIERNQEIEVEPSKMHPLLQYAPVAARISGF
jgi:hypothetical protein